MLSSTEKMRANANVPIMTRAEVAQKASAAGSSDGEILVIVNGDVLDVSRFKHPGGAQVLKDLAGKDVTKEFYALHKHQVLEDRLDLLRVAKVAGFNAKDEPMAWSDVSSFPYAETQMVNSPYYKESHIKLRAVIRKYLWDSGIYRWCNRVEVEETYPTPEIRQKFGRFGLFALLFGPGDHLKLIPEPNCLSMSGIKVSEVDYFHQAVVNSELARMICPGTVDGIMGGTSIGIGPVFHFGKSQRIKDIAQAAFSGDIALCLGVTEPMGGTDVAGVKTVARKVADGYIINGSKKFITGVCHAHYCTCLVRLADDKSKLAVLLVPLRDSKTGEMYPGVSTRPIHASYSSSAGTGLLVLENVHVTHDALLGEEGQGLEIILHNFNMERMNICNTLITRCRRIIEESFLWCTYQREAFGKRLVDMPVVRLRLGELLAELSVLEAGYERLLFQYSHMSRKEQNDKLGGPTALLKYSVTRGTLHIADQVVQLFGGRGCAEGGMGSSAYRVARSFKIFSVGGGTEDAMLDLAVRQAQKSLPRNARL